MSKGPKRPEIQRPKAAKKLTVALGFTPEQHAQIAARAKHYGLTVEHFIKAVALYG